VPEAYIEHTNQHATLQDKGRFGFKHLGIGSSGPADGLAFAIANQLVGNPTNTCVFETLLGNMKVRFSADTRICITGAEVLARLNGEPTKTWASIDISAGDTLELGFPKTGNYNYVAIYGGFSAEPMLGSCAVNVRDALGPLNGKPLANSQKLPYSNCNHKEFSSNRSYPIKHIPNYQSELNLRFIPSDLFEALPEEKQKAFATQCYKINPQSNKMGARLDGNPVELPSSQEYSQAVCLGTIQLPPSGQPMVLLADHQTIGGYPKLGTVYLYDCYLLAQRRPGQTVKFVRGNLEMAQESAKKLLSIFST